MTEFRTTTDLGNSLELLHLIAIVSRQINPAIEVRAETFRKTVLIRILFPVKNEIDQFLAILNEKGITLNRWAQYGG